MQGEGGGGLSGVGGGASGGVGAASGPGAAASGACMWSPAWPPVPACDPGSSAGYRPHPCASRNSAMTILRTVLSTTYRHRSDRKIKKAGLTPQKIGASPSKAERNRFARDAEPSVPSALQDWG